MKIAQTELIDDLIERTKNVLNRTMPMQELSIEELNARVTPESWSVLECMEHLNRYGNFYLSEIGQKMEQSKHIKGATFKSSWLGEYFAKSMLPREKLNKMNTFKNMNPLGSTLDKNVVTTFLQQQKDMLQLLQQARGANLTKVKTGITLTKWIRLRLGDTFRVVIYHNQRHVVQMERVLTTLKIDYAKV